MKKILKRGMSGLLAVLMAFTVLAGFGTTTAFAASETAESYMISFPRDGDAAQIYSEDAWGHSAKSYMNGWATGSSNYTTLHCMDSFDGKVCYCIEPGLSRNVGDTYHGFGEDFWDNYPSQYNNTIEPDDIKLLLGRIMQYGYQGNLSTSWRSQNDSDADIVVALDEDNQNTLKRYAGYDEDSGYYILEYENEEQYPGKTIKLRSFQVQGVARHVIKSL